MFKISSGPILRQYFVILSANLATVCFGLNIAWSSPMLVKLKDGTGTGLSRPVTDEEGSWIVSIGVLAGLPIHCTAGLIMDKIGRKTCLLLSFVPRVITGCLLVFATEVWMLLLGRAIDGLAGGLTIAVVATYSSEIASKEIRGALGTILQAASASGMLVFFGIAPFLPYFYVNVLYLCICVAACIPIWFLPESPYYLYVKGRKEESKKILSNIRSSDLFVEEDVEQYELSLDKSTKHSYKKEILQDSVTMKTLAKVVLMSILLELVGYNAVLFYMMTILQLSQTTVKEETGSVVLGCIQLVACFFTSLLTDKLGRKPILIGTLCGLAVGMVGLGTFFYLKDQEREISGILNYMPLFSMILVIFSFNAGLGSLLWTLVAELFNSSARAIGVSVGVFTASAFVFITTKSFVSVVDTIGPAFTYWIFSIICIVFVMFIIFFIPETKGKTFLQIQNELRRKTKM